MSERSSLESLRAENGRLRRALAQCEQKLSVQSGMVETIRSLSGETSLDVLLARIMEQATVTVLADRSSLFLYDRAAGELWSKIAQGLDTTVIRFSAGQGISGYVARTGKPVNVPDAYADPRFNPDWDHRTGYRTRSVLAIPLISRSGETIGVLQVLNKTGGGAFTAEDEELLGALATNAAAFVENAQLHERIQDLFEAFARVSISAIDERDPATSGHSVRVAASAVNLARLVHCDAGARFGAVLFTREELRELRYAALLHDYGKIGVRENVLCKATKLSPAEVELICHRLERGELEARLDAVTRRARGEIGADEALIPRVETLAAWREIVRDVNRPLPLTEAAREELDAMLDEGLLTPREHAALSVARGNLTAEEWEDMRSHVTRSYQMLCNIPWPDDFTELADIVWAHHERMDGTGYPRGLPAEGIPLGARIIAVADTYDALVASDRPYKKAISHAEAMGILRLEAAAGHLDADLVELFIHGRAWEPATEEQPVAADVAR